MADVNWDAIQGFVVGTTKTVDDAIEHFGLELSADDVEHELGLRRVQICPVCGWWTHTWHLDGVCEDDAAEWDGNHV